MLYLNPFLANKYHKPLKNVCTFSHLKVKYQTREGVGPAFFKAELLGCVHNN